MRAGEVKCPTCSAGLRDVAPDYPVAPEPGDSRSDWPPGVFDAMTSSTIEAHCFNGHRLMLHWKRHDDGASTFEVSPWP